MIVVRGLGDGEKRGKVSGMFPTVENTARRIPGK